MSRTKLLLLALLQHADENLDEVNDYFADFGGVLRINGKADKQFTKEEVDAATEWVKATIAETEEEPVDNGPRMSVTARQAKDGCDWDKFCEVTGLNPWALAEGMDENAQFSLTIKQAKYCGLIK